MSERADARYVEDSGVAFAMYCDEHELTADEGRALAERIADELANLADEREFFDWTPTEAKAP